RILSAGPKAEPVSKVTAEERREPCDGDGKQNEPDEGQGEESSIHRPGKRRSETHLGRKELCVDGPQIHGHGAGDAAVGRAIRREDEWHLDGRVLWKFDAVLVGPERHAILHGDRDVARAAWRASDIHIAEAGLGGASLRTRED